MKILHLCSDFCYTNLYFNFVRELDKLGYHQIVYVPLKTYKSEDNADRFPLGELKNVEIILSPVVRIDMRLRYFLKMRTIYKDIKEKVDFSTINFVHSHFLYSDGGVALKIKNEFGIPYITAIRNTDVNVFYKYLIHCRSYAKKVLIQSTNVIFISPSYKKFFDLDFFKSKKEELLLKTKVIPNGISDYWHSASEPTQRVSKKEIVFIYVGELNANKNLVGTIGLLNVLRGKGLDAKFKIIGPIKSDFDFKGFFNKYEWVDYLGAIYSKEELQTQYDSSDVFIMLSKKETFGLVYVEAMSRGLPILYTKGQGIDGYFEEGQVGYSLDIENLKGESQKVNVLIENYDEISKRCVVNSQEFQWNKIVLKYSDLYAKYAK